MNILEFFQLDIFLNLLAAYAADNQVEFVFHYPV